MFPDHTTYVEPFAGSLACLWLKPPSQVEVVNDINHDLINFFRVLANPEQFPHMLRRLDTLPYSREQFLEYLNDLRRQPDATDPIERAVRWFVVAQQSFAGDWGHGGWRFGVRPPAPVSRWLKSLHDLTWFHARLRKVQIECDDWLNCVRRYDTPDTLFYLDPPYHPETRVVPKRYQVELDRADHLGLVNVLLDLKGMVVLSGYAHPDYDRLEQAGWLRTDIDVICRQAMRNADARSGQTDLIQRTESVWVNPNCIARRTEELRGLQLSLFEADHAGPGEFVAREVARDCEPA